MMSLSRRLLLSVGVGTVLVWLVMALTSYVLESRRLHAEFDIQLSKGAELLQDILQLESSHGSVLATLPPPTTVPATPSDLQAFYQVIVDGQVRLRSASAPLQPLANTAEDLATVKIGHDD